MEKNNAQGAVKEKLDKSIILVISPDTKEREAIFSPLKRAGFAITFCSSTHEAFSLLPKLKPGILIQDWDAIEPSQAVAFHQRLIRNEEYAKICRIVLVEEISDQLQAIAVDCSLRRLLTKVSAQANIVEEVRMALAGEMSLTPLQNKIREMRSSATKYNQGEIDNYVEDAYTKFSHDPTVKLEFGNLCSRRNNYPEAEQIANSLLKAEPNNVRAMNLLSRCLMKTGRMDEGIKVLENANILSPKNPERLVNLGQAFFQKGDKQKAKACLVEALEVDPKNQQAAENLGEIALEEGDAKSIVDMFENSLSEEEIVGFFNNAAITKVRQSNVDDALSLYEMAINATLTPHVKCLVQFNIGLALKRIKDMPGALRAFKRCLKLDPNYEKAKAHIQEIEATLGDPKEKEKEKDKDKDKDK